MRGERERELLLCDYLYKCQPYQRIDRRVRIFTIRIASSTSIIRSEPLMPNRGHQLCCRRRDDPYNPLWVLGMDLLPPAHSGFKYLCSVLARP